jgi:hypothetical protein
MVEIETVKTSTGVLRIVKFDGLFLLWVGELIAVCPGSP